MKTAANRQERRKMLKENKNLREKIRMETKETFSELEKAFKKNWKQQGLFSDDEDLNDGEKEYFEDDECYD